MCRSLHFSKMPRLLLLHPNFWEMLELVQVVKSNNLCHLSAVVLAQTLLFLAPNPQLWGPTLLNFWRCMTITFPPVSSFEPPVSSSENSVRATFWYLLRLVNHIYKPYARVAWWLPAVLFPVAIYPIMRAHACSWGTHTYFLCIFLDHKWSHRKLWLQGLRCFYQPTTAWGQAILICPGKLKLVGYLIGTPATSLAQVLIRFITSLYLCYLNCTNGGINSNYFHCSYD